ncbi:MAG: NUDIX hydrolase [Longispora sp.]|nr:NUDIX hydrolase [Longispora sp. (in: high G+C Gram-positive bacteria)]
MEQQRFYGPDLYAFLDRQHKVLAAAAALFRDEHGQFLLLKTWYRDSLVLPGGMFEPGDSPRRAAKREVLEELGLDITLGRLLVVDHRSASIDTPESLQFIFDGGLWMAAQQEAMVLQAEEIVSAHWVSPAEIPTLVDPGSSGHRILQAIEASADGSTRYLEDGFLGDQATAHW